MELLDSERSVVVIIDLQGKLSVGFEWARDKDHPAFKAFSALLREGQIG